MLVDEQNGLEWLVQQGGGSAYRFSAPACACCGDMVPGATMCVVHVLVEF